MLHVSLFAPSGLIFTHSMLQVKHWIFLLALLIICRSINHCMAPLVGRLGKIVQATHLSLGNTLLRTIIVALIAFRNLDTTRLTVTTEEGLCSRINKTNTIDFHEIVVESRNQRIGNCHPVTLTIRLHIIFLSTDINDYLTGLRSRNAEISSVLFVHLRELIARDCRLSNNSINRNLNLLWHLDKRTLRLIS